MGGEQVVVTLRDTGALLEARETLASFSPTLDPATRELTCSATDAGAVLTGVTQALAWRNIALDDIAVRRPSLDEVFLELTGDSARNDVLEVA